MMRPIICNFGEMIRDVNGSGSSDVSPGWDRLPSDLTDPEWEALGH